MNVPGGELAPMNLHFPVQLVSLRSASGQVLFIQVKMKKTNCTFVISSGM